jgi:hypothetical protein
MIKDGLIPPSHQVQGKHSVLTASLYHPTGGPGHARRQGKEGKGISTRKEK